MKSKRVGPVLVAAAMLVLAGCAPLLLMSCVSSKAAWERSERNEQVHANAPARFVGAWERYLTQAQGRYGILALDRNLNGMAWKYCVSGCQGLFGNQNQAIKSAWAFQALDQCEDAARKHAPGIKPDCDIYALRDEIVWRHAFPWRVKADPSARREPAISTPPKVPSQLSTRTVATTWEGYADVMTGQISFEIGRPGQSQQIIMVLDDGKMTCDGSYRDRRATWTIECTNGRSASGRFVGLGAGKGARGTGTDSLGYKVQFIMGAE